MSTDTLSPKRTQHKNPIAIATRSKDATRNKCIATSNKCLTSSNKKLLVTRAPGLTTTTKDAIWVEVFVLCSEWHLQALLPLGTSTAATFWLPIDQEDLEFGLQTTRQRFHKARTLPVAPGHTSSNKKLLGAEGIATGSL